LSQKDKTTMKDVFVVEVVKQWKKLVLRKKYQQEQK
jgi:hypothetical protein